MVTIKSAIRVTVGVGKPNCYILIQPSFKCIFPEERETVIKTIDVTEDGGIKINLMSGTRDGVMILPPEEPDTLWIVPDSLRGKRHDFVVCPWQNIGRTSEGWLCYDRLLI